MRASSPSHIEIIAEIGQNHNGDVVLAKELISAAKLNGANVAKFQLYDVDAIFDRSFAWYSEAKLSELTRDLAAELSEYCSRIGIEFMASVFDLDRVAWCEEMGVRRYKIASRSVKDCQLLEAIAATGKDMIISLGMWDEESFPKVESAGRVDYLYCVAKYPTLADDICFSEGLFSRYDGFSDHTIGIDAALVAVARGARIIEKHFTLDKGMRGPDHICSMVPAELRVLSQHVRAFTWILYH